MDANSKLKRNVEKKRKKNEIILTGSSEGISLVGCKSVDSGGSSIPVQSSLKYLGVYLDQTLSV